MDVQEHVEINGAPATAEGLRVPALNNCGHFTAMQVRGGAVRGLESHLRRLAAASRELFGAEPGRELLLEHLRHALGGTADAAVRIYVYWPEQPLVMVVVRPPAAPPSGPLRLASVPYQRPFPHIKHVGGFGQHRHRALAAQEGFDEALLTGPDGLVAETAVANIGFLRGREVVWPEAPALTGIAQQLLDEQLAVRGDPVSREPVRLRDIPDFDGAFVANSIGIAPVSGVDGTGVPENARVDELRELHDAVPWDRVDAA